MLSPSWTDTPPRLIELPGDAVSTAYLPADCSSPLDSRAIGTVLMDRASQHGDSPALFWFSPSGDLQRLTYGQLAAAASCAAHELLESLSPGDRLAVWSANCPEWVVLEYAAALAGVMLTPLNPALADGEAATLLAQSGAGMIFASEFHRGSPLLERAARVASSAVTVRPLSDIRLDARPVTYLPDVPADSPFLLQYTSGTTGRPKGVVLTHAATFNAGRFSAERLGLTERDTTLCALPLHHVGASVCLLLPMLAAGGAVALVPGWDTELVVRLVAATQATMVGVVPTMLLDLLDHPGVADGRLESLRLLQGGGATLAPSLIRRAEAALSARFVVGYGQSEAPVSICSHPDDSPEDKALTIGRPLPHREVRIVQLSTGEVVPYGEVGELQIRSALNMNGYWRDADASSTVLDHDGWLHSGDLCSMDVRGMVTIVGRARDLIIRGGENIFPSELEDVILAHPAVADVAIVGAPSERWGEEPVAFVKPSAGASLDTEELDAWVRERLAGFKRPRGWFVVDSLPLTASGKVQKFRLRELLQPPSNA